MRKLPQADELPHTEEGYDPARVEEAFAAFADRVRELEIGRVRTARGAEGDPRRADRSPHATRTRTGRPRGLANTGLGRSPDWVAAVPPPFARRPALPRLVVEGLFLLLVAVLAGLADLSAAWIVLVMGVAWALVALTEWAAAAKRSRWRLDEIAPPADAASKPAADTTGPWDMPVVRGHRGRVRPGPGVEDDRRRSCPSDSAGGRARAGEAEPERRRSAAAASAAPQARRAECRRSCRRSLGGVSSSRPSSRPRFLIAVPGAAARRDAAPGAASGTGADGVLRPHGGGLRHRAEASDRAGVRPGRAALRDAGDRRDRRRRPGLLEAPRPRARVRDAARARLWSGSTLFVSAQGYGAAGSRSRGRRVVSRRTIVDAAPVRAGTSRTRSSLGPDGRLYLGSGSTCDVCTREGPAQRRDPLLRARRQRPASRRDAACAIRSGSSSTARRSTSPTTRATTSATNEPAETVVRFRPGADYGWPRCWASWRHRRLAGLVPRRHPAGRLPRAALLGGLARALGRDADRGGVGPVPERALGPEARPGQRPAPAAPRPSSTASSTRSDSRSSRGRRRRSQATGAAA